MSSPVSPEECLAGVVGNEAWAGSSPGLLGKELGNVSSAIERGEAGKGERGMRGEVGCETEGPPPCCCCC